MFELSMVNQWHVLTEAFVLITGNKYSRLFFISFHVFGVLISLKYAVSFLDALNLFYFPPLFSTVFSQPLYLKFLFEFINFQKRQKLKIN